MSGFVCLHRDALDHPLLQDAGRLGAFFWLVARAAWKPVPFDISGKIITLERGQLCTSRSLLAKAWGWSPSAVERFLTRLKTEQMIEQATGQGKSVITICNYEKYQSVNSDTGQATGQVTGQPSDSHRTAKEQGNKGTSNISSLRSDIVDLEIDEPDQPRQKTISSDIDEAVSCWNKAASKRGWPEIRKLSAGRKKKLRQRISENGLEGWKEALRKAMRSQFLCRGPDNGWFKFDWMIHSETNLLKVLEGSFDDKENSNGNRDNQNRYRSDQPSDALLRAAIELNESFSGRGSEGPDLLSIPDARFGDDR